jgi:hypothetical protein
VDECVRVRSILAVFLVSAVSTAASAGVEIHTSCAAEVASDPAHVRTLRAELTRALAGVSTPSGTTLDVSIVRFHETTANGEVEVRTEARAFLSDGKGRVQWSSSSRATARGAMKERTLVQRDAITAVAQQLAKLIVARAG